MSISIYNEDCLERMEKLDDKSVDLVFCDLPYGQTNCKWDTCIDLERFWKQIKRIRKDSTPIIFTTTTKFGVDLILSNRKEFRHDYVWKKSKAVGFLNAKKMRMTAHEMVYVFYKKLPKYNILEYHTHKFKKISANRKGNTYGANMDTKPSVVGSYDPPLPQSVINSCKYDVNKNIYGGGEEGRIKISKNKESHTTAYEPPLPNSIIKTEVFNGATRNEPLTNHYTPTERTTSVYNPPLPNSVLGENVIIETTEFNYKEGAEDSTMGKIIRNDFEGRNGKPRYDPPLPNSYLEIKSEGGKHATQKPIALMEFFLKYFTDKGDVVLDPTMGSGSTGVACMNLERNFIGIEMDETIFKNAENRLVKKI